MQYIQEICDNIVKISERYMDLGSIYKRFSDNKVKMSEKYIYLGRKYVKVIYYM